MHVDLEEQDKAEEQLNLTPCSVHACNSAHSWTHSSVAMVSLSTHYDMYSVDLHTLIYTLNIIRFYVFDSLQFNFISFTTLLICL